MALGKPIVTTPIGNEGISTTSGENILIANDEIEFVNEIGRLVNDQELYDRISRNAIEYIHEKFDNLALAGALVRFYKEHTE